MDSVRDEGTAIRPGVTSATSTSLSRRRWLFFAAVTLGALTAAGLLAWDRHRARREWREAGNALSRHDLVTALTHLDRYVQLRPQEPEGWFLAARTARRAGRLADAERYLGECEKTGGDATAIRLERDLAAVERGELGEIDAHLRSTIGPDHPDVGFVLEALARGYLAADRLADAREACELWQKVDPTHPWPWLWSGWVCERMTQWDQATDLFRHALELHPDSRDAHVSLARALLRRRHADDAVEHFDWAIARDRSDVAAELGLAECRIEQGRAGEAVPLIEDALHREPSSAAALYLRGKAASALGDAGGAENWLRGSLALHPGHAEALHLLIATLRAQRKDGEADELAPKLEQLRADLQRLSDLLRLIGPKLQEAGPCHEAGVIALRLGRTKEGVNLLKEALRRKGNHQPTHAALAAYYRENGPAHLAELHQGLAGQP
jgi:tetratricopeptide (TPR) repeat protein